MHPNINRGSHFDIVIPALWVIVLAHFRRLPFVSWHRYRFGREYALSLRGQNRVCYCDIPLFLDLMVNRHYLRQVNSRICFLVERLLQRQILVPIRVIDGMDLRRERVSCLH